MKKLIIFLLMMLPLGVFAQESKIAIVNTQEVIQAMPEFRHCGALFCQHGPALL